MRKPRNTDEMEPDGKKLLTTTVEDEGSSKANTSSHCHCSAFGSTSSHATGTGALDHGPSQISPSSVLLLRRLPTELLYRVLHVLDAGSLVRVEATCSFLRTLDTDRMWRALTQHLVSSKS